jgi:hypothetical protein
MSVRQHQSMTQMNREWAIEKLKGFLHTAAVEWVAPPHGMVSAGSFKFKNSSKPEAQAAAHIAEQILDRVIPDWRSADWEEAKRQPMWRHREAAHRAVAFLEAEQELQENLGSGAPQLDAATLHPWVWGSVQGLWSSGHFREAVGAAARAVNVQSQAKLGRRDASEAKLLSDAFSTNQPAPGHPRLRLSETGATHSKTATTVQETSQGVSTQPSAIPSPTKRMRNWKRTRHWSSSPPSASWRDGWPPPRWRMPVESRTMLPERGVLHARGERAATPTTGPRTSTHAKCSPRQCHGAVVMRAVVSSVC